MQEEKETRIKREEADERPDFLGLPESRKYEVRKLVEWQIVGANLLPGKYSRHEMHGILAARITAANVQSTAEHQGVYDDLVTKIEMLLGKPEKETQESGWGLPVSCLTLRELLAVNKAVEKELYPNGKRAGKKRNLERPKRSVVEKKERRNSLAPEEVDADCKREREEVIHSQRDAVATGVGVMSPEEFLNKMLNYKGAQERIAGYLGISYSSVSQWFNPNRSSVILRKRVEGIQNFLKENTGQEAAELFGKIFEAANRKEKKPSRPAGSVQGVKSAQPQQKGPDKSSATRAE